MMIGRSLHLLARDKVFTLQHTFPIYQRLQEHKQRKLENRFKQPRR
jgi:hypothetical protein